MTLVAALLFTLTSASEGSQRLTLLLDTSNSMEHMIGNVRACGLTIVDGLGAQDRAQLLTFSGKTEVAHRFTSSRSELIDAIGAIRPVRGTSALRNALYVAIKSGPRDDGKTRLHTIALISDGDDTSSRVSEDQVQALAETDKARIFAILLPTRARDQNRWLARLAEATGGHIWRPEDADELKSACEALAQDWRRPSSAE